MAAQLHVAKYISSKRGKPILIDQNSHEYRLKSETGEYSHEYQLKSETGESKYWESQNKFCKIFFLGETLKLV